MMRSRLLLLALFPVLASIACSGEVVPAGRLGWEIFR
jgi:hypothetical protein